MMISDMQAEFKMALESAYHGDYDYLWEIVKVNKGVIFGVVIPTTLIIRYPSLLVSILRGALFAGQGAVFFLLQSGFTKQLSYMLWTQIIKNSETQINYLKLKEQKRAQKSAEYKQREKEKNETKDNENEKNEKIKNNDDDNNDNNDDKKRNFDFRWKSRK